MYAIRSYYVKLGWEGDNPTSERDEPMIKLLGLSSLKYIALAVMLEKSGMSGRSILMRLVLLPLNILYGSITIPIIMVSIIIENNAERRSFI